MSSIMPPDLEAKNRETSRKEVEEWLANPPSSYIAYVKERENLGGMGVNRVSPYLRGDLITWMGDKLGAIYGGLPYKDNMGATRVSIDVVGTNGVLYYGTYYKSSGDYARIRAYKNQAKTAREKNYTLPAKS